MFLADLKFGKSYEQLATAYIPQGETQIEFAPKGCFKGWDFKTEKYKYEVKSDRLAYKYGCNSMFIEFECNGKPSGITSTEADFLYYFMVRPNGSSRLVRAPVKDLKEACVGCPVKSGGDGWRSKGYIVPITKFETQEIP